MNLQQEHNELYRLLHHNLIHRRNRKWWLASWIDEHKEHTKGEGAVACGLRCT